MGIAIKKNLADPSCGYAAALAKLEKFLIFVSAFFILSASLIFNVVAQAPAPPVKTERVQTAPVIRKLELSGTVTAPKVSQISTSVEGLVGSVHFDSGATVTAGTLLLELDAEMEEAAYKQAEAQVRQAAAEVADAKRRLNIAEDLAKRAIGPQNDVEARKAEIAIDTAAYEASQAVRDRRSAILERHSLKAPFAGVISKKLVEAGQWVDPGTAVFELVAMENFRIDVAVPQTFFAQLSDETEVAVKFDAIPGEALPARIGALIPVSDPDSRTFTLRVLPAREGLAITPGMSARVVVKINTGGRDIVVSRDALIRYPDGRIAVWVVEKNGEEKVVKERRIEIGLAFDGVVQVLSGLKAGEDVVVRGNEALRDGQVVRPIS